MEKEKQRVHTVGIVLPIFSPSPDANGGIDLLAIDSSDGLTLQLSRMNLVRKGESIESRMMKGY